MMSRPSTAYFEHCLARHHTSRSLAADVAMSEAANGRCSTASSLHRCTLPLTMPARLALKLALMSPHSASR